MKINVSQTDIDNGICGDDNKCPIALSIKRAFKNDNVSIYYENHLDEEDPKELIIRVDDKHYRQSHIDKYEHCDNFVQWFDDMMPDECKPFKFNIDTSKTTI